MILAKVVNWSFKYWLCCCPSVSLILIVLKCYVGLNLGRKFSHSHEMFISSGIFRQAFCCWCSSDWPCACYNGCCLHHLCSQLYWMLGSIAREHLFAEICELHRLNAFIGYIYIIDSSRYLRTIYLRWHFHFGVTSKCLRRRFWILGFENEIYVHFRIHHV